MSQRLFVHRTQLRLGLNDREKVIEINDSIVEKGNGGQSKLRKRKLKERLNKVFNILWYLPAPFGLYIRAIVESHNPQDFIND